MVMATEETPLVEALSRAHGSLLEDLRKLEEAAGPASGVHAEELAARLAATRAHITEHFRFEEQNGYMDAVRKREPRLERTVQDLAEEHQQLAQALDALLGEVRAARPVSAAFRTHVQDWVKAVRQHEQRENDLVQDAFAVDIGTKD
jgi:hypothetical protein